MYSMVEPTISSSNVPETISQEEYDDRERMKRIVKEQGLILEVLGLLLEETKEIKTHLGLVTDEENL